MTTQKGPAGLSRGFCFPMGQSSMNERAANERPARTRRLADKPNGQPPKGPVDRARIAAAVREILLAVGEDPDREGLLETPERVARMYEEMFSGMRTDPV